MKPPKKGNILILLMPDGSMQYCAGHFEIQPKAINWRLFGSADFRIGDLPSGVRCAHLLDSGTAPEIFAAQFRVAKVPTSQLLFPSKPALERFTCQRRGNNAELGITTPPVTIHPRP